MTEPTSGAASGPAAGSSAATAASSSSEVEQLKAQVQKLEDQLAKEPSSDIASAIKKKLEDAKKLLKEAEDGVRSVVDLVKAIKALIAELRGLVAEIGGMLKDILDGVVDEIINIFKKFHPHEQTKVSMVAPHGINLDGPTDFVMLDQLPSGITVTLPAASGAPVTALNVAICDVQATINGRFYPDVRSVAFAVTSFYGRSRPIALGGRSFAVTQILDGSRPSAGVACLKTGRLEVDLYTLLVSKSLPLSRPVRVLSKITGTFNLREGILHLASDSFDFVDDEVWSSLGQAPDC